MMNGFVVGADREELRSRVDRLTEWGAAPGEPWIVGTPEEIVVRLREYEAAGVQRVFLQHLAHRDLDMVELLAGDVIPALQG